MRLSDVPIRASARQKGSLRAAFLLLGLAGLPVLAQTGINPEAATGRSEKSALVGRRHMVVTANPHASDAALAILRDGGNAMDAALAAQWALNVVEPQSSGLGGGAFILYWDAKNRTVSAWDGRETAPADADVNFARRSDGSLYSYPDLVGSGRSVGTPGLVALLEQAHRAHGRLPWSRTFNTAVGLAASGFGVSPRLASLIGRDTLLPQSPSARALFFKADGTPLSTGDRLVNPALAESLREISKAGGAAFYSGLRAARISAAVKDHGGWLSQDDLAKYQPKRREAVCNPYRGRRVCSMPPPSSGGITLLQILALLELSGPPLTDFEATASLHRFAEAGRLAYADRARYLADPDFVSVPQRALLEPVYLSQRAQLIDPIRSLGRAVAGDLPGMLAALEVEPGEIPATTHLSIVDDEGNAVAMTSSVESAFGSRILVDGFLLNNHLTDFSWASEQNGKKAANRLEPGKRPLSSMAPTLVFGKDGELEAMLGSPGGPLIINFVAATLVALFDAGMAPDRALARQHLGSRNGVTDIESGTDAQDRADRLKVLGHEVRISELPSGSHIIVRSADKKSWIGAADPRREGVARGE